MKHSPTRFFKETNYTRLTARPYFQTLPGVIKLASTTLMVAALCGLGLNLQHGAYAAESGQPSKSDSLTSASLTTHEAGSSGATSSSGTSSTTGAHGSAKSKSTSTTGTPSTTPTSDPAPAPSPAPAPAPASEKFGMSAPASLWTQRLSDVGGPAHIKYRRIYHTSGFGENLTLETQAQAAGMVPVISWKTGGYSWADVAAGKADADLWAVVAKLNAVPGAKIVSIHHEPYGDGTAADWAAMQQHALPILANASNVQVGVIANGWWWTSRSNKLSDAQIAQWIPSSLVGICDFIGADTYEDEGLAEDASTKITNMVSWAGRVGGVKGIGIGEWNGLNTSGASITRTMNVVKAQSLVKWALEWNSADSGVGLYLSGNRLQAFKTGLATSDPTSYGL
jgi:hypothetical protein